MTVVRNDSSAAKIRLRASWASASRRRLSIGTITGNPQWNRSISSAAIENLRAFYTRSFISPDNVVLIVGGQI